MLDANENNLEENRKLFHLSSRSEFMNKDFRDRSIDISQSSNSLRKSINRSTSRSPKKMSLISLKPISEERCKLFFSVYIL